MPWSWPPGARVLLASLIIAAGLGLAVAGGDLRATSGPAAEPPEFVLDVNSAPLRALMAVPHLGPTLANRLVEARAERPFASLEDVQARVRGIGPVTRARIAPHLRIESDLASTVGPGSLASAGSKPPPETTRSPRRKPARARRPATTPRQPRLVAQAQAVDTRPDLTVADRK